MLVCTFRAGFRMRWLCWGFLVLSLACAAESSAEIVTGSISGTVTNITKSGTAQVPDSVTLGDTVAIQFSYDSASEPVAPPDGSPPSDTFCEYPNLTLTAEIEGLIWEVVTPGQELLWPILVKNHPTHGDSLSMISSTIIGGDVGSSFATNMGSACEISFRLYDNLAPFDFLSSTALPASISDVKPTSVTGTWGWIYADGPGSDNRSSINFELHPSTLQIGAVPEPSAVVLFLSAAIGVGLGWRRQHRGRQRTRVACL